MKQIKTVAVVGMGALGLLFGTKILETPGAASLEFVMDSARAKKYTGKTFYKNGKAFQLPVCPAENAVPADLVIVAVKGPALAAAMEEMTCCVGEKSVIMSVLNGISSEETLSARFGKERLVGTVAQGMDAVKLENRLTYTCPGELHVGALDPCQQENVDAVLDFLARAGIPYVHDEDIRRRMWSKWMLNVGVNQACMVYETGYGGCLLPGEANRTMIAAMREVIALAGAEGVSLGEKDLNEYERMLHGLAPEGMPSMRQDGLAHRPTEVELFAGTVRRMAKAHGLLTPTNDFLYQRVREMEASWGEG